MRRMTTGGVHRHEWLPADLCVMQPRMTVKGKAAVRPTLVSIAVPHAEPDPDRPLRSSTRSSLEADYVPQADRSAGRAADRSASHQKELDLDRVLPLRTRPWPGPDLGGLR